MKKDDLYIAILHFGKANLGKPIKFIDLREHLTSEGYEFDEFSVSQFFSALFVDSTSPRGNTPGKLNKEGRYFLEHEGYFNLLEHEELVSARTSSFWATIFASIAIVISIISAVCSVYYSQLQIKTPVTLNQLQLDKMNNVNIENSINTLIDISKQNVTSINALKEELEAIKAHNNTP
ncbi:hypothetical protein ESZ36_20095 [Colwellia demingiae]|uniref:Uncharacterized protein n=1 Tax=Colwellia demingiae TaxID=89401 RepID=A0A5C6Q764_9GAMM|nr:hypothetical protein [Colwellia demingiae]TWX64598.1 hypothetical protein ESZ36_20095 [Colwellia demingiae]